MYRFLNKNKIVTIEKYRIQIHINYFVNLYKRNQVIVLNRNIHQFKNHNNYHLRHHNSAKNKIIILIKIEIY